MNEKYKNNIIKLYLSLKKEKMVKSSNYIELGHIIEDIAVDKLKLGGKYQVKYAKMDKKIYGFCFDNKIQINSKQHGLLPLSKLANSIFHEFRHIYQNKNWITKDFNTAKENNFIPQSVPNDIGIYLGSLCDKLSAFDLYIVSDVELDARTFAYQMTLELFKNLLKIAQLDKKNDLIIFCKLNILSIEKQHAHEINIFNKNKKNIQKYGLTINKTIYFQIKDLLNNFNYNNTISYDSTNRIIEQYNSKVIANLTKIYCDDEIKEMVLKKAREMQDPFLFSTVVNSPFCKIDEATFKECIQLFYKNHTSLANIKSILTNWNENQICAYSNDLQSEIIK